MTTETHPLQPFLPEGAVMLFLGSFPPPRARWSMEFFYPNWINDFWRIQGLIHYGDKTHFEVPGEKRFDRDRIIDFATEHGMAFYDTARRVRRLRDNASDNFLEVIEPTDVGALLAQMPQCHRIISTGGKSADELLPQLSAAASLNAGQLLTPPAIGDKLCLTAYGRDIEWWRMPSTSRAYPLSLDKKAAAYARLF